MLAVRCSNLASWHIRLIFSTVPREPVMFTVLDNFSLITRSFCSMQVWHCYFLCSQEEQGGWSSKIPDLLLYIADSTYCFPQILSFQSMVHLNSWVHLLFPSIYLFHHQCIQIVNLNSFRNISPWLSFIVYSWFHLLLPSIYPWFI
jgi:hypothetical protein